MLLAYFRGLVDEVRRYFGNVFSSKKLGVDYYAWSFCLDLISFFLFAIFPNAILGSGASDSTNILAYLNTNQIPLLYFILLLAQFILILVERIIYLFRSAIFKLALTYTLTIVYHIALFIWLPLRQGFPWSSLAGVIILYLIKALSLFLGAMQVRQGYPQARFFSRTLMEWKAPGTLSRLFPFKPLLRSSR